MKTVLIKFLATVFSAFVLVFAIGCEAGEGLGEDIQDAGEEVEDTADDAN